jgi:predicted dinucleotide-binding enzyme
MTTVGLIGSGNVGITVAQLAIEAGHQVVLSNSRGPVWSFKGRQALVRHRRPDHLGGRRAQAQQLPLTSSR